MHKHARVLMYTQDSYGLGHLRRATNLANALVRERADLSVLLLVDSPVAPFFDLHDRIDFVKLPTVVKVDAGVFRPGRLHISYPLVKILRSNVSREVLRQFRPDLVLVDHMPGGANRDLIPALQRTRLFDYHAKIVLGVRDIIDHPTVTRAVWQREGFYEVLKRYYDAVLIYGSPDVFPTAETYGLRDAMCGQVRYCGYICNMDPVKDPQHVRAKLQCNGQPLVTVMAGGGADAHRLMQTYLDAVPLINNAVRVASVMVTGPFMPESQNRELRRQARRLGVQIHGSVGDSLSHLNAADLVVSMAGYNTLSEILRFRKPAVIVPREGPSAEQRMRASIFAERGLVSLVDPLGLSAARLAGTIVETLTSAKPPCTGAIPGLFGIRSATSALLDLLPPRTGTFSAVRGETPSVNSELVASSRWATGEQERR
jgi:predicted glycosyltransferase